MNIHSILLLNTSYHLNLVVLFYVQDYDESIVRQENKLGVLTYEGFSRMSSGKNASIDLVKTKAAFAAPTDVPKRSFLQVLLNHDHSERVYCSRHFIALYHHYIKSA
jgi:hypothetical protein